ALLVVIGALADGTKEVLAVVSGFRESKESWRAAFKDLKDRGLEAPRLVVADGNIGAWSGAAEVWPEASEQRCWNHKIVNVLDRLPQKLQAMARVQLGALPYADRQGVTLSRKDSFH